jgi:hypothetical protein
MLEFPFREPKLGEMLKCGVCYSDIKPIDQDWLKYFYKQTLEKRMGLFSRSEDCFLSYDGCESSDIDDLYET